MLTFVKTVIKGDTMYIHVFVNGKYVNVIPINIGNEKEHGIITDGIYKEN